jgi:hypothetical protein
MNLEHLIAFFQIIGVIGAMQCNPLRLWRKEDIANFEKAILYLNTMEVQA